MSKKDEISVGIIKGRIHDGLSGMYGVCTPYAVSIRAPCRHLMTTPNEARMIAALLVACADAVEKGNRQ